MPIQEYKIISDAVIHKITIIIEMQGKVIEGIHDKNSSAKV